MTKILIVDDDVDIREELASLLTSEGYAVCMASNGVEAMAQLGEMAVLPHLLILDLMMPKMNGHEVLAVLQRTPHLSGVPVIVITALGHDLTLPHARRVFSKPFDLAGLLGTVEELCAA